MVKDMGPAGQALHDELLGQSMATLFDDDLLLTDVAVACEEVVDPLRRLSGARHGAPETNDCLRQQMIGAARHWKKLACGLFSLNDWLVQTAEHDQHTLKDFVDFVALTRALATQRNKQGWPRLEHLLGLATLRLKLDPSVTLARTVAQRMGLVIRQPGTVDHREIAAACSIRLATVRNALSRREMSPQPKGGVSIGEAMDWMIKRKGFLYPAINAESPGRRINGRLAASFLAQSLAVEHRRRISRLRLSEWQVKATGHRFAINDQGVQHCLVMLVIADIEPVRRLGAQALENRSHDPTAKLYQESFPTGPGQQLWQFKVPTMAVLEAFVAHLGEHEPRPPAIAEAYSDTVEMPLQAWSDDTARLGLGRDCQADQE